MPRRKQSTFPVKVEPRPGGGLSEQELNDIVIEVLKYRKAATDSHFPPPAKPYTFKWERDNRGKRHFEITSISSVPPPGKIAVSLIDDWLFDHQTAPDPLDHYRHMREWWDKVTREHGGKYHCYGVFLMLPGDTDTVRYLNELGDELDQISGLDCLILAFSDHQLGAFASRLDEWRASVKTQVREGHSLRVAHDFGIRKDQMPCMILFEDYRYAECVRVPLKNRSVDQIRDLMRGVFSEVEVSARTHTSALTAIENYLLREGIKGKLSRAANMIIPEILRRISP